MYKKDICDFYRELSSTLNRTPSLNANIRGSEEYPDIYGCVKFYENKDGVLVLALISGLPTDSDICREPIFSIHIHGGNYCSGDNTDAFKNAGMHYNPNSCEHPYHSGDMPVLFSANGRAVLLFLTDRFSIRGIVGKTVIIHSGIDDFKSQPAGNSGKKIACGVIK